MVPEKRFMGIKSHTKVGRRADGLAHEPLRTKQMEKIGICECY